MLAAWNLTEATNGSTATKNGSLLQQASSCRCVIMRHYKIASLLIQAISVE